MVFYAPKSGRAGDGVEFEAGFAEQFIDFTNSIRRSAGHGDDHLVKFFGPALQQAFWHADYRHFVDVLLPFLSVIVKESDDDAAEFPVEFQRQFRARGSGSDDADAGPWLGQS